MLPDILSSSEPDPWAVDDSGFPESAPDEDRLIFLLRYAILAPSTHNTQPWEFEVGNHRIDVFLDRARWLRIADADQRELHLSVGCALENLLIAAEHYGLPHRVIYFPRGEEHDLAARVLFDPEGDPGPRRPPRLFHAIPARRTNRRTFDGRALPDGRLEALHRAVAAGGEDGVGLHFTRDESLLRRVEEMMVRADAVQFSVPERRAELGGWLGEEAFRNGWFLSRVARLARAHLSGTGYVAPRAGGPLEGASALGVLDLGARGRAAQLRAGQAFERVFLTATAEGLSLQPLGQALQLPGTRRDLLSLLPRDRGDPQILFRLGWADPAPHAPRRPLSHVVA